MNTELTNISNKIQQRIADKAAPTPDPLKVMAADVAEILQDFVNYLDGATLPTSTPPTNGVVNDTDNTLTFELAEHNMAKIAITQHEYSLDNGSTWATCTSAMDNGDDTATISVGNIAIATGSLIVRRIGETDPDKFLRNTAAFTITAGGPTGGGAAILAANYNTLANATTTEADLVEDLLLGLETDGTIDAFATLHLVAGDTEANMRYNAVDPGPDDLANFNLIYEGTPLKVAGGLQWQGGQGAKVKISLKNLDNAPFVGGGAYVDDPACYYIFLHLNGDLSLSPSDGGQVWAGVGAASVASPIARPLGLIYAMRRDNDFVDVVHGSDIIASLPSAYSSLTDPNDPDQTPPKGEIGIWGAGNWVMKLEFNLRRYLSEPERITVENRFDTFLTGLGRI